MKKVVMVIAADKFRDEELLEPKMVLEKAGIAVTVASSVKGAVKGALGALAQSEMLYTDVRCPDFDAVVFIGGAGASQYWNDPFAHKLLKDFAEAGKLIAAICIAPVTLAKAGLLKGKKATVWASESGQLLVAGAKYTGSHVEQDGRIITAAGPFAARQFGEAIAAALAV